MKKKAKPPPRTEKAKAKAKASTGELQQIAEQLHSSKRDKRGTNSGGTGAATREIPPPSNPMAVARQFLEESGYLTDGQPTLQHWRGSYWLWQKTFWQEQEDRTIRSFLYRYTEFAVYVTPLGYVPWKPNRKTITDLMDALTAIAVLPAHVNQPSWLDHRKTGVIVACQNGLLDVERGVIYDHTPKFFSNVSVPFDYNPQAPKPERWLYFLNQLWPPDNDVTRPEIAALGEWYGYIVSGRTDLHKAMLQVGPTRGGKGIIGRILTALIGPENVCGPTLGSLGNEFGLESLLGKSLAILSDIRSTRHTNSTVMVERLLSISGEDTLSVPRKFRTAWTGKLPCRLQIMSNEVPNFDDASSAIIGRLIVLILHNSWLGREDHTLEGRLREELSGILNWALDGLHRLTVTNKNQFTAIKASDNAIRQMRDLASPVRAYVRENCTLGDANDFIEVDQLFLDFKVWIENNNYPKTNKHVFGRNLHAAFPAIGASRPTAANGKRFRAYTGIRLRPLGERGDNEGD
jgi:putative DNA primase/helicase